MATADPPVRGFATICCLGHYREVAAELLEALMASGLYDRSETIDLAVLGPAADQDVLTELVRPFERIRVRYRTADLTEYEYPALRLLQDTCRSRPGLVYYLHTKGVSRSRLDQHSRYWRRLMLDYVVWAHEECRQILATHDTVGTNWRGDHYSGNFWWARAEHIRRLPDLRRLRASPRPLSWDPVWNDRLQCEFWVGMARGRFANLGPAWLDLYHQVRWTADAAGVVNDVLAAVGGDRYLELVIDEPSPYVGAVATAESWSVSVRSRAEAAAALHAHAPDVVFVDTWHDAQECRDVVEACVAGEGPAPRAVVVHDSNPPTRWHQRPGTEYVPGSEWNGTVWRVILELRAGRPDLWVRTVDADWGCTVVLPRLRSPRPFALSVPEDPTWEWFETRREAVLDLVSPDRFRRELVAVPLRLGDRSFLTRTDVLNYLVSWFRLDRYLEVGVAAGENFRQVVAVLRHGVDSAAETTYPMSSDAFFGSGRGCPHYDLIFVDGLHEEEQCLRDLEHALARLSPQGWLVVHDANPPTEWHQRPAAEFRPGEEWNGAVWRAIVRFRVAHPESAVVTLDLDWGCTVIRRRAQRPVRVEVPGPLTWDLFAQHRVALLNLHADVVVALDELAAAEVTRV